MKIDDTVRITIDFATWAGSHAEVTEPQLIVYDDMEAIQTVDLTPYKLSAGKYQYDFLVPLGTKPLTFKATGILEGTRITNRISEPREW